MDIKDFLLARIAEDEERAELAAPSRFGRRAPDGDEWSWDVLSIERDATTHQDRHVVQWWPGRVLAECQAKRSIIERWEDWPGDVGWCGDAADAGRLQAVDSAARALAAIYSDHPDYQPEWAQEAS